VPRSATRAAISALVLLTVGLPRAAQATPGRTPHFATVTLSHDGNGTASVYTNATSSTTFTLTSIATTTLTVNLVITVCNGSLAAGSCTRSPTSVSLAPGDERTITVGFTGGLASGSGTITLAAKNTSGATLATSSVTVTVNSAGGTPPTVSAAPHLGDRLDVGLCVADCFDATFGYATPAYVSRDVPRSVALQYRSGWAKPYGRVTLDVSDVQFGSATAFQLQLQDANGANVTFANGSRYVYFTKASGGPTRVTAEFDASGIGTSAGLYTAYVTAFQGSTPSAARAVPLRIIIINDMASEFGAGVELAGVQHVFTSQSGGVLVTDGSGTASFFSGSCTPSVTCTFTSPAGDFSVLTTGSSVYKRTYPDGTVVTFNSSGFATSVADRFGNATSYAWVFNSDANKTVLSTITDPTGQVTSFTYRNSGNAGGYKLGTLAAITTPGARSSNFGVVATNDLQVVVDPDGGWFASLGYDTQHRLTSFQDKKGGIWNYTYAYGKTLSYVDAPSVVISTGASVRPRTQVREAYSGLYSAAAGGSGTSIATAIPVPAFDVRAAVTDPLGYSTFFSLNRYGSPRKTYAPMIPADSVEYIDSTGQVTRTISPTGHDVRYTWNGSQLKVVTDVTLGKLDSLWYASKYNLVVAARGASGAQYSWYDSLKTGWPLTQTSQSGSKSDPAIHHYADATGRDTAVADPLGHRTRYHYATSGFRNTDTVSAPNGQPTSMTYDGYGRTVSTRNPYGVVSSTGYDVLNRTTWSTPTSAHDTTFVWYDALNADTLVKDAKGQQYKTRRNALGWVTAAIDPAGLADSSKYDVAGQLVWAKSRANRTVSFLYDSAGRVTQQRSAARNDEVDYAYDPLGKWVKARSVVAGVEVSVDSSVTNEIAHTDTALTRRGTSVWRIVRTFNSSDPGLSNVNVYTPASPSTPATYTYYTYDAQKRLTTIRTPLDTTSFAYNSDNLVMADTLRAGLVETRAYTSSHVLSDRSYVGASVVDSVLGRWYQSDSLARLVQRGDTTRFYQTYGYDATGRLNSWIKKARGGTPSCVNQDGWGYVCSGTIDTTKQIVTPTYDAVGNPSDLGATLTSGNRLTAFNGVTMSYDADGFMLTRQVGSTSTDSFVWDDFGRLVTVTRTVPSGSTTTYTYDGFGRRIKKVITGTGATTVQYLWDGDQIALEMDATGATTQTYAYYPGVDQPRSVAVAGQTYFMSTETDGTINGLIRKSDKAIVAQYAYTPWGELERDSDFVASGIHVNSLRWKGLSYDRETGLNYVRARYYDPKTRRFISEDPIGLEGGINEYQFASGDPINHSDPTGLDDWYDGGGVTCIIRGTRTYTGGNLTGSTIESVICLPPAPKPPSLSVPDDRGGYPPAASGQTTGGGSSTSGACANFSAAQCNAIAQAIVRIDKAKSVHPTCAVIAGTLRRYFKNGWIHRDPDYIYPPGPNGGVGSSQFGTWSPRRIGINDITFRGGYAPNGGPVPPLPQVLAHEGYHASFPEDKRDSNFSDPPYAFGAICGGR
jgi:RHS repeat-associated protein